MAYSDYGGYAYRNGERVEERSDFTITPDGGFGTPGIWPGFALVAAGKTKEEVDKALTYPTGHAVLGDGPLFVALYKQSSVQIYVADSEKVHSIPLIDTEHAISPDRIDEYEGKQYLNTPQAFTEDDTPTRFVIGDHTLDVRWVDDDNYYVFARLEQPDGTVWTGFSGYGVGAGLEDCGYGFSTGHCAAMLRDIYP